MSHFSFIEVVGGALVATSAVANMSVESTATGYAVVIEDTMGYKWNYCLCDEEDEAFAKMHALAEAIGPVYSEQ